MPDHWSLRSAKAVSDSYCGPRVSTPPNEIGSNFGSRPTSGSWTARVALKLVSSCIKKHARATGSPTVEDCWRDPQPWWRDGRARCGMLITQPRWDSDLDVSCCPGHTTYEQSEVSRLCAVGIMVQARSRTDELRDPQRWRLGRRVRLARPVGCYPDTEVCHAVGRRARHGTLHGV